MHVKQITPFLSVSPQILPGDVGVLAAQGFRAIINNRPDDESEDQPASADIASAAVRHGLDYRDIPVVSGAISDQDVQRFRRAMAELEGPVLAFCRTGTRSVSLWALAEAPHLAPAALVRAAAQAGYDLHGLTSRLEQEARQTSAPTSGSGREQPIAARHDVVIVGGGAGGIAAAASLLKRRPGLDIAIIEPRETHYYQPGWTLVGGGVFDRRATQRSMTTIMPKGVRWIRAAAAGFVPERGEAVLEDGSRLQYRVLVAAPGIRLDWDAIPGLRHALGHNGVTSNYLFDMAPYTWELVQTLKGGRALFTQPPMPIKCAGAPQKAMYLSCCHWRRTGRLKDIEVEFHTAGAVLFGVKDYVPALMEYVRRYDIALHLQSRLVAVDGEHRQATFEVKRPDGSTAEEVRGFDMLHVCPPQTAPEFVRRSPLADSAGWIEVDEATLQHRRYGNVFGLGDACSAPNAKTAAAVRNQAPVVAENVLAVLAGERPRAIYNGYGSCPLTVERGKIVLAEFAYGGKLDPTFPPWLLDGTRPSRAAWLLKEKLLPPIYWELMLKGYEWFAAPELLPHAPAPHEKTSGLVDTAPQARVRRRS